MKNHPLEILAPIAAANSPRFASLVYTAKGSGEVARHTVALGVSVENAYRRDLAVLRAKRPALSGIDAEACDELIASLAESLKKGIGNNSAYTCADASAPVAKGIKVHKETGEIHIFGFTRSKAVLTPGTHKVVNSSAKTLSKNALRKTLKSGKFRQFALSSLAGARIAGKTLVFE